VALPSVKTIHHNQAYRGSRTLKKVQKMKMSALMK